MKRYTILFAGLFLLAGGCSDLETVDPAPDSERTVEVNFNLCTVDTDTSVEPMTRATAYKEWFNNACFVLILKKSGTRWIVDATQTVRLDSESGSWAVLKLDDRLVSSPFHLELRPGDYRAVAVINYGATTLNKELVPGTVVADETDPALPTPPLVTYMKITSDWAMNKGYRMLHREIFVAVTDFTVPKSDSLRASGMPPVRLQAERRVGKMRFLLKDIPDLEYSFQTTAHTFRMVLKATEPFPEGIDALGNIYYSDPGLFELPWCMSTVSQFHSSGSERYQMCQTNSTVFSPFLFADPRKELPFEVVDLDISGASGGYSYITDEVFSLTLAASRITGLVFQVTDRSHGTRSQTIVDFVEAVDAQGRPEDAAALFDPFYEWNASSY